MAIFKCFFLMRNGNYRKESMIWRDRVIGMKNEIKIWLANFLESEDFVI